MKVGDVIDKYRITRLLGEGGMGAVYAAENTVIGKAVAIKVLRPEHAGNRQVVERFLREARTAASVDHPGIVEVFDFGWAEDGAPYLVMALLKGESLAAHIDGARGPLPVERAVAITAEVLSVLGAVHDNGIVHRDLKPDNVFLARRGDGSQRVRVLDFGISKMRVEVATRLTQTGTVLGTPYYMSPEQAHGAKDVDHRADLWAVGVILYEMLTGRLAFPGDSYNEVLARIIGQSVAPLDVVGPDLPGSLVRVVERAMSWERGERYQSAHAFLQDLRAFERAAPQPALAAPVGGDASAPPGGASAADAGGRELALARTEASSPGAPAPPRATPREAEAGSLRGTLAALVSSPPDQRPRSALLLAVVAGGLVVVGGMAGLALWLGGRSPETIHGPVAVVQPAPLATPDEVAVPPAETPTPPPVAAPHAPPEPAPPLPSESPPEPPTAVPAPPVEARADPGTSRPAERVATTRDSPGAATPPAPVAPVSSPSAAPGARQTRSPAEIRTVIGGASGRLAACVGMEREPPSEVRLTFRVEGDGRASLVRLAPALGPVASSCLRRVVAETSFGATGADPVTVTHPVRFSR